MSYNGLSVNWVRKNGEIELIYLHGSTCFSSGQCDDYVKVDDDDCLQYADTVYPKGITIRYKKIDSSGF